MDERLGLLIILLFAAVLLGYGIYNVYVLKYKKCNCEEKIANRTDLFPKDVKPGDTFIATCLQCEKEYTVTYRE